MSKQLIADCGLISVSLPNCGLRIERQKKKKLKKKQQQRRTASQ